MGGQAVAVAVAAAVAAVAAVLAFVKKLNDTSCLVLLSLQNFHSIIHVKQKRKRKRRRKKKI